MAADPRNPELKLSLIDALRRHVEALAGLIGPRYEGRPSTIEAAKAHIRREWQAMGFAVREETYPSDHGRRAANLIAEIPGRSRANELVILSAHYDTVPTTPGADDNASAVAGLLEASCRLRQMNPTRTIRLIAFANEEPPHFQTGTMGSQHHARLCRDRGERIRAMVCLEMIGYYDQTPDSQSYPDALPAVVRPLLRPAGDFIGVVSNPRSARRLFTFRRGFKRASDFPLIAVPLPERIDEIHLSDHASFWQNGFPAIMVTDTSFLRNPHYHQPTDTPDTLDYESMAHVIEGVVGGVVALAG